MKTFTITVKTREEIEAMGRVWSESSLQMFCGKTFKAEKWTELYSIDGAGFRADELSEVVENV